MLDIDPKKSEGMSVLAARLPRLSVSTQVFECPWFRVHEEMWGNLSSLEGRPFYRIDSPEGVLVLAITKEGDLILVRQFRPALRRHTMEFPAGSLEAGETSEEAAARELLEETGYRAGRLRLLGRGHMMMNRFSAKDSVWLAQHCEVATSNLQGQAPDVLLVSPQAFKDLVTSGRFEHLPALSLLSLAEWQLGLRLVV